MFLRLVCSPQAFVHLLMSTNAEDSCTVRTNQMVVRPNETIFNRRKVTNLKFFFFEDPKFFFFVAQQKVSFKVNDQLLFHCFEETLTFLEKSN